MSITRRLLHPPPPLGVCISHRYPSLLPNEDELFAQARATSRAVGLETGPSDGPGTRPGRRALGDRGGGARLGGGKDAELAKLVTGFDAVRARALGRLKREDLDVLSR